MIYFQDYFFGRKMDIYQWHTLTLNDNWVLTRFWTLGYEVYDIHTEHLEKNSDEDYGIQLIEIPSKDNCMNPSMSKKEN